MHDLDVVAHMGIVYKQPWLKENVDRFLHYTSALAFFMTWHGLHLFTLSTWIKKKLTTLKLIKEK